MEANRDKGSVTSNASAASQKSSMKAAQIRQHLTPGNLPQNEKCAIVPVIDQVLMVNCFTDEPVSNEHIHAKLAAYQYGKERLGRYELFQICTEKEKYEKGYDSDRLFKYSEQRLCPPFSWMLNMCQNVSNIISSAPEQHQLSVAGDDPQNTG